MDKAGEMGAKSGPTMLQLVALLKVATIVRFPRETCYEVLCMFDHLHFHRLRPPP